MTSFKLGEIQKEANLLDNKQKKGFNASLKKYKNQALFYCSHNFYTCFFWLLKRLHRHIKDLLLFQLYI